MRTVIVGDLQYRKHEDISQIVDDIISLCADNVILLGDYGNCGNRNKFEEFEYIAHACKRLNVENFVPLLGNHDVQHEIMQISPVGSAEEMLKNAFGITHANAFLEFEDFSIFCLGCECPPERNAYSDYECYLSADTVEQLKSKLAADKGKPVIVITHAPPCCSGLLNKPSVHLRASNAYLNQDHEYTIFADIVKENPQIKAWFCGHYHIGHDHIGSVSQCFNTHFFLTAAPTSASRDGQHHTHVLDFTDGEFYLATYDHDRHSLNAFKNIDSIGDHKEYSFVGEGRPCRDYIYEATNGHIFVMTDNGFLWEIDVENRICLGTIHYSQVNLLDDFYVDEQYVWRVCGTKKFGHDLLDPNRFMREYDYARCNFIERNMDEDIHEGFKIYSDSDGWFTLKSSTVKFFNNEDHYLCMVTKPLSKQE